MNITLKNIQLKKKIASYSLKLEVLMLFLVFSIKKRIGKICILIN